MLNKLIGFVAPHYCYGCYQIGTVLCDNCKYDIADESFDGCIVCATPVRSGICSTCQTSYERAWCVSDRTGLLETLINTYKFDNIPSAAEPLAELLDSCLPLVPASTIIVPVPTIPPHIRRRGFDHTLLLAQTLARRRRLSVRTQLTRRSSKVQLGASKADRLSQAKGAFVARPISDDRTYLLIDDVVTTNATVRYAAQALRDAGAQTVWVAALARQPLDNHR